MNKKIEFQAIDWEQIATGAKQKLCQTQNKTIRLLRLNDSFLEAHWCTKGHIGYVLEGEMTLDFNGNKINYKVGDAFIIKEGEATKHKAIIENNKFVKLLLVEELKID